MSTTKLTLSISQDVVEKAKIYAKKKGTSISNIVENWLKQLASENEPSKNISPEIISLKGIISLSDDYNYKEDLGNLYKK